MTIYVGVIGAGLVGTAFLKQLAPIAESLGVAVVFVARSKQTAISKSYSPLNTSSLEYSEGPLSAKTAAEFLSSAPGKSVVVDNTADGALALQYPEFVRRGIAIVTPNKKAFASSLELWNELHAPGAVVYHEATVGAGLPVLSSLKDLVITGDKVKKIEGILSGSLSFIFNTFSSSSQNFSEIVAIAKQRGYTEPDPRDDLNGMDAARKVTILARLAGLQLEGPESFPVESLVPAQLESAKDGDEFMSRLSEFDSEWESRKQAAATDGEVLRYVGSIDVESGKATVAVKAYPKSHPFASLTGADNVISFTTERYPSPLIIQGAGAGDQVTAMGVLSDLVKVVDKLS